MSFIRHDGKRILTEADVDREFLGRCVLLDCREFPQRDRGYLIASVDIANIDDVDLLDEIKRNEFGGRGLIIVGSKAKGEMILGYY